MVGRFQAQKREARRALHKEMSVRAFYFMDPLASDPTPVTIRIHEKWVALGDMKGTNFNYAEISDIAPRIIFMRSEVEPKRAAFVSVEPGVAYRIDSVEQPDDISVTARVIRLDADETEGFPVPAPEPGDD